VTLVKLLMDRRRLTCAAVVWCRARNGKNLMATTLFRVRDQSRIPRLRVVAGQPPAGMAKFIASRTFEAASPEAAIVLAKARVDRIFWRQNRCPMGAAVMTDMNEAATPPIFAYNDRGTRRYGFVLERSSAPLPQEGADWQEVPGWELSLTQASRAWIDNAAREGIRIRGYHVIDVPAAAR
jgi:hypothetical protein